MDEENKKINIDSFFNRIEEVDQVAGKSLKQSNLNANAIQANKTLINSLLLTIETMKTDIRDIANYIIIERKLEKDAEEDRKLELEDAEQKKSMTDRALAVGQSDSKKIPSQSSPQQGGGGGGGFLSGLLGAIATGGLIALAAPLVPVIAPLLLGAMKYGIMAIAGMHLLKKFMPGIRKNLNELGDGLKNGLEKTKQLYTNLKGRVENGLKDLGDSFKTGFKKTQELYTNLKGGVESGLKKVGDGLNVGLKKTQELYKNLQGRITNGLKKVTDGLNIGLQKTQELFKNLEGKFLKLAGDVGGFLKKKGEQSVNLLKRTTGGVADFLTGGVFDFDKKGESITDNVLVGNKIASQGVKGVINSMKKENLRDSDGSDSGEGKDNEFKTKQELDTRFDIGSGRAYVNGQEVDPEEYFKFKKLSKDDQVEQGLNFFKKEINEEDAEFDKQVNELRKQRDIAKKTGKTDISTELKKEASGGDEKLANVKVGKKDKSVEDLEREYAAGLAKVQKMKDEGANERRIALQEKKVRITKSALDMKKAEMGLVSEKDKAIGKMLKESGMGEGKSSYSATTEYKIIEPIKKRENLDLSLEQNLETTDKLVNAVTYESGVENKDQNNSVLVQSKPAQVTIASIKKTSSPVAFIKSNKNKFLSINETELPPEVLRMIT